MVSAPHKKSRQRRFASVGGHLAPGLGHVVDPVDNVAAGDDFEPVAVDCDPALVDINHAHLRVFSSRSAKKTSMSAPNGRGCLGGLLFCGLGFLVSGDVFAYTGARFHGLGVTHFRKVPLRTAPRVCRRGWPWMNI
jgi:hypothetical protein